ncbi:VanZ family protein [Agrococcus sp. ProA11]|uniref:VanZ family protein n=1 Tax=Agrococcus chionoecetis TaxID=3153752 RepID=UPI003261BCFD
MSSIDPPASRRDGAAGAPGVSVRFVPRSSAPLRRVGAIGLLLALPVVALLTLWPSHLLLRFKPRVLQGIEWFHAREMLEWVYWTRLEVLANVAMFVPLAALLVFLLGARRWWLALALCLAATVGIELVQHVLLSGRVASAKDVVANTAGAVIGVLIAVAIEAIVRAARRRSARRRAGLAR